MINIVIPMAGRGSRFSAAGYATPKPLLPVHGVPMIEFVIRNLAPQRPHRFTFICQREHLHAHKLDVLLHDAAPGCSIIVADALTQGAACSVLLAAEQIDDDAPLVIANCDQYCALDMDTFLAKLDTLDGLIAAMTASDPKWSYAALRPDGLVASVVEKQVISDIATVGIYGFAQGSDFCRAAREMIASKRVVNGEYYVAPTYNTLVAGGACVGIYPVGREAEGMFGLGTPDDLEFFLAHPDSHAIVGNTLSRCRIGSAPEVFSGMGLFQRGGATSGTGRFGSGYQEGRA
jgi:dTDP-glucose pyrophosphorylase